MYFNLNKLCLLWSCSVGGQGVLFAHGSTARNATKLFDSGASQNVQCLLIFVCFFETASLCVLNPPPIWVLSALAGKVLGSQICLQTWHCVYFSKEKQGINGILSISWKFVLVLSQSLHLSCLYLIMTEQKFLSLMCSELSIVNCLQGNS